MAYDVARYQLREGSESGHCCFNYTIVDTTKPVLSSQGKPFVDSRGRAWFETVCECFDEESAQKILRALNSTKE